MSIARRVGIGLIVVGVALTYDLLSPLLSSRLGAPLNQFCVWVVGLGGAFRFKGVSNRPGIAGTQHRVMLA